MDCPNPNESGKPKLVRSGFALQRQNIPTPKTDPDQVNQSISGSKGDDKDAQAPSTQILTGTMSEGLSSLVSYSSSSAETSEPEDNEQEPRGGENASPPSSKTSSPIKSGGIVGQSPDILVKKMQEIANLQENIDVDPIIRKQLTASYDVNNELNKVNVVSNKREIEVKSTSKEPVTEVVMKDLSGVKGLNDPMPSSSKEDSSLSIQLPETGNVPLSQSNGAPPLPGSNIKHLPVPLSTRPEIEAVPLSKSETYNTKQEKTESLDSNKVSTGKTVSEAPLVKQELTKMSIKHKPMEVKTDDAVEKSLPSVVTAVKCVLPVATVVKPILPSASVKKSISSLTTGKPVSSVAHAEKPVPVPPIATAQKPVPVPPIATVQKPVPVPPIATAQKLVPVTPIATAQKPAPVPPIAIAQKPALPVVKPVAPTATTVKSVLSVAPLAKSVLSEATAVKPIPPLAPILKPAQHKILTKPTSDKKPKLNLPPRNVTQVSGPSSTIVPCEAKMVAQPSTTKEISERVQSSSTKEIASSDRSNVPSETKVVKLAQRAERVPSLDPIEKQLKLLIEGPPISDLTGEETVPDMTAGDFLGNLDVQKDTILEVSGDFVSTSSKITKHERQPETGNQYPKEKEISKDTMESIFEESKSIPVFSNVGERLMEPRQSFVVQEKISEEKKVSEKFGITSTVEGKIMAPKKQEISNMNVKISFSTKEEEGKMVKKTLISDSPITKELHRIPPAMEAKKAIPIIQVGKKFPETTNVAQKMPEAVKGIQNETESLSIVTEKIKAVPKTLITHSNIDKAEKDLEKPISSSITKEKHLTVTPKMEKALGIAVKKRPHHVHKSDEKLLQTQEEPQEKKLKLEVTPSEPKLNVETLPVMPVIESEPMEIDSNSASNSLPPSLDIIQTPEGVLPAAEDVLPSDDVLPTPPSEAVSENAVPSPMEFMSTPEDTLPTPKEALPNFGKFSEELEAQLKVQEKKKRKTRSDDSSNLSPPPKDEDKDDEVKSGKKSKGKMSVGERRKLRRRLALERERTADGGKFHKKNIDPSLMDEETRMEGLLDEDSQGSTTKKETRRFRCEVIVPESTEAFTAEKVFEYVWPLEGCGEHYFIQEQISQYLGIMSFKRRYPDLRRRPMEMQERDYLREKGLVSEMACDLGLTAVRSEDVLDVMLADFQDKFEELQKYLRERKENEIKERGKVNYSLATLDKSKMQEYLVKAAEDSARWNATFNRERRDERRYSFDLQTFSLQMPHSRHRKLPADFTRIGAYPVAVLPGQFTDFYREYTPSALRSMPLSTVMANPNSGDLLGSDGNGSESEEETPAPSIAPDVPDTGSGTSSVSAAPAAEVKEERPKDSARCKVCNQGKNENKNGKPEPLIICGNCRSASHPVCIDLTLAMVPKIESYNWQCMDCKSCVTCSDPDDEDKMIFCDMCDRGYHIYCVGLRRVPNGRWHCKECAICNTCGAKTPSGSENIKNAEWQHEFRKDKDNKQLKYATTLCVPCDKYWKRRQFCTVCIKVYRSIPDDGMVRCSKCPKYIHREACSVVNENNERVCNNCHKVRNSTALNHSRIIAAAKKKMASGY